MADSLDARTRDEIDDQVAEAFDAYLADRLAEPGPLSASLASKRSAGVVLGTIGLGSLATALASTGDTVVCWIWGAIGDRSRLVADCSLPLTVHGPGLGPGFTRCLR